MAEVSLRVAVVVTALVAGACGGGNSPPPRGDAAPGAARTGKTAALESGANLHPDLRHEGRDVNTANR
jgi:hypothetical protein